MTCIDDLFDWLLEDIFQKLPRHDRLICKEVCVRWLKLLMERAPFRGDRHIYLRKCAIKANHPPMSLFPKAKYPYDIVSIQSGVKSDNLVDVILFGCFLGISVMEVVLDRCDHKNRMIYKILHYMPLVRKITFNNMKIKKAACIFTFLHSQEPSFSLRKLEALKFVNHRYERSAIVTSSLKIIKQFIPKETQIFINFVHLLQQHDVEKMLPIIKVTKLKDLHINASIRSNEEMNTLLEAEILHFEDLHMTFSSEQLPYLYLEAFLSKYQNVKTVTLSCYHLPPAANLSKLTELYLTLEGPRKSLKPLDSLVNLNVLQIISDIGGCGILHEPVTLMNLKEFVGQVWSWTCIECLETLANSFKSLTICSIHIRHHITLNTLKNLIKNWHLLEKLKIIVDSFEFQAQGFEGFDHPYESLRSLHIGINMMHLPIITVAATEKLGYAFPNLETLSFFTIFDSFEFIPSLEKIVQDIVPAFTKLTHLQFWAVSPEALPSIDKPQIEVIVKQLVKHRYPLENAAEVLIDATPSPIIFRKFALKFDRRNKSSYMEIFL